MFSPLHSGVRTRVLDCSRHQRYLPHHRATAGKCVPGDAIEPPTDRQSHSLTYRYSRDANQPIATSSRRRDGVHKFVGSLIRPFRRLAFGTWLLLNLFERWPTAIYTCAIACHQYLERVKRVRASPPSRPPGVVF